MMFFDSIGEPWVACVAAYERAQLFGPTGVARSMAPEEAMIAIPGWRRGMSPDATAGLLNLVEYQGGWYVLLPAITISVAPGGPLVSLESLSGPGIALDVQSALDGGRTVVLADGDPRAEIALLWAMKQYADALRVEVVVVPRDATISRVRIEVGADGYALDRWPGEFFSFRRTLIDDAAKTKAKAAPVFTPRIVRKRRRAK